MISTKKKVLIFVLIIIGVAAVVIVILNRNHETVGNGPGDQLTAELNEDKSKEMPEESLSNDKNREILDRISGKTYIYYDEFMEGKPVTYTFYDDGKMVAYYWEDTESESIPLSSEWAKFALNETATEISFEWDDGTNLTESFKLKGSNLIIGEAEFKLSDREIFLN